ncbi:hypothetical protein [Aestuariivirga sp.]|uniref:hypothetical protein n=1 Tax=Aestuariivirga sp. TaxID=2650926 RepID=UPI0039E4CB11
MRRVLSCLLFLVAALTAEASARVDTLQQPMKVVLVRSNEPGCEPSCPEWIMAEGRIGPATAQAFVDMVIKARQRMRGAKPPVILRSPGGTILSALQIGSFLRAQGLDVGVGTTAYEGCAPFSTGCTLPPSSDGVYRGRLTVAPSYCLSACPLILAAGKTRLAGADATVGVHHWGFETGNGRISDDKGPNGDAWDGVMRRMITDYLEGLGNAREIEPLMETTPFSTLHVFSRQERRKIGLVTGDAAARSLTAASTCGTAAGVGRCVLPGDTDSYRASLLSSGVAPYDPPMTFTVTRASGPACEPVCPQWISARGAIRPETPRQFLGVLGQPGMAKLPLVVDSPGGDLDAALALGRLVHARGMDVMVAGTSFAGCADAVAPCPAAAIRRGAYRGEVRAPAEGCRGVCVLVLAAGRQRAVEEHTLLRLHNPQRYVSRAAQGPAADAIRAYLAEVGASGGIFASASSIAAGDEKVLTAQDALPLGLVSRDESVQALLAPKACGQKPRPGFCVRRR